MIYLGADHRGYDLKEKVKTWLNDWAQTATSSEEREELRYEDLGNFTYDENDDFPDIAKTVAKKVVADPEGKGILICGTGAGMEMTANKTRGVRATVGFDRDIVRKTRLADNINILALPADFLKDENMTRDLIKIFLGTPFSSEDRYLRRINKIEDGSQS